jgi:alkanesulfonate monooxygenase SsuD/methylene tetrahydromethanopterin reductase-like flavin-dependent oxidoreductase (luciferase family)
MRIGVQLAQLGGQATPEAVTASARSAEALGFDSVWVIDPLLSPIPSTPPSGAPDEGSLFPEARAALDPLTTLAFAAGATDRIRLGTSVLAATRYTPTVLARSLATVDVLSGGRLTIGLDLGWSIDEHDVMGRPPAERAARQESVLDVLEAAWTSAISPKPVQRPRPPVLLSAHSPKGLDRLARRADGWAPSGLPVASVAATFRELRDAAASYGRDPESLQLVVRAPVTVRARPVEGIRDVYTGSIDQIVEDLAATAAIGASEMVLALTTDCSLDEALGVYATLAEGVERSEAA